MNTFTLAEYKENEQFNDHTLNALKLVEMFGTTDELHQVQMIADADEKQGFLTMEQTRHRYELSQKYYKLLVKRSQNRTKSELMKLAHAEAKFMYNNLQFETYQAALKFNIQRMFKGFNKNLIAFTNKPR